MFRKMRLPILLLLLLQTRADRRPPVELDDADELGLAMGMGLTTLISNAVHTTASTVRVVADTAAGAAGGSVKVIGGAVKSVATAVETIGDNVAQAGSGHHHHHHHHQGGGGGGGGNGGAPGANILGAAIRGVG